MKAALKKKLKTGWDLLAQLQGILEEVSTQHTIDHEAHSEAWMDTDNGEKSEMDCGELEDAQSSLEEVVACIDRIIH